MEEACGFFFIDFYINWIFYFVTAPLNRVTVTWIHGAIQMLLLLLLCGQYCEESWKENLYAISAKTSRC